MLVFFALFGVFLTQYLPLWMSQNESQFTYQAQASMETLKQYVDDQAIFGGPQTYAVPFTVSSQGIPLFAQPTQGGLAFLPGGCAGGFVAPDASKGQVWAPVNVNACSFQHLGIWLSTNVTTLRQHQVNLTSPSSYVQMQLPNRYFPAQSLYYENDAVVSQQSGGNGRMLVAPPITLMQNGGNVSFTASYVLLVGNPSSYQSQGSKDLFSTLVSNTTYSSVGRFPSSFAVSYSVGTRNICAWNSFLRNVTAQSGLPKVGIAAPFPSIGYNLTLSTPISSLSCPNPSGQTYEITLTVFGVTFAQAYAGDSQIALSIGGL